MTCFVNDKANGVRLWFQNNQKSSYYTDQAESINDAPTPQDATVKTQKNRQRVTKKLANVTWLCKTYDLKN